MRSQISLVGMAWRQLCLGLCLLVLGVDGAVWSVLVDRQELKVFHEHLLIASATITSDRVAFQLQGFEVDFDPAPKTPAEIPSNLNPQFSFSTALQLDRSGSLVLAQAFPSGLAGYSIPYVYNVSDNSLLLFCEPELYVGRREFVCWYDTGSSSNAVLFLDSYDQPDSRAVYFNFTGENDQLFAKIIALAGFRALSTIAQTSSVSAGTVDLAERESSLRLFAVIVYLGLLLQLTFLMAIAYWFLASPKVIHRKISYRISVLLLLVVIVAVCISFAGLAGFFAVEGLLILIAFIGPFIRYMFPDSFHRRISDDVFKTSFKRRPAFWKVMSGPWCLYFGAAVSMIFVTAFILGYEVEQYFVWDRSSSTFAVEYQPPMITKSIAAVYAYEDMAQQFRVNWFFQLNTDVCSNIYRKTLKSKEEKRKHIYEGFIKKYGINMSHFQPENYEDFNSVNDWFIRGLKPGARQIAFPEDLSIVVSPADSRIVAYENFGEGRRFWLKGDVFDVASLLKGSSHVSTFLDGSLLISRLSPQDYHRYHSPIAGEIVEQFMIDGDYHSVNADAVTSGNEVLVRNARQVNVIQSPTGHKMAFVPVGANCVGSIVSLFTTGQTLGKGQEAGYFQFGGSTIVMIFEQGMIDFDDDLLTNSEYSVETFLQVGQTLGSLL